MFIDKVVLCRLYSNPDPREFQVIRFGNNGKNSSEIFTCDCDVDTCAKSPPNYY